MAKGFPKPTKFVPLNKEKYSGDWSIITSRSSWETKFMRWADSNPSVLKWNSEEVVIPYMSPVDNRMHRYFVDFAILIKKSDGTYKRYLVEIKPQMQTLPPKKGKRTTNKYVKELSTYAVNQAKWKHADEFCKRNGLEFLVLTEQHLF